MNKDISIKNFYSTKKRSKRFIHRPITKQFLDGPKDSKGPLTLYYSIDVNGLSEQEKRELRKIVNLAANSLSQLNFIKIKPALKPLGTHPGGVPFSLYHFKQLYGNYIKVSFQEVKDNYTCSTFPSHSINNFLSNLSIKGDDEDFLLSALYTIRCDHQKLLKKWRKYAPGILAHEFIHTFGINHAHNALVVDRNRTQAILAGPSTAAAWERDEQMTTRYKDIFGSPVDDKFPLEMDYNVGSPFSIMHYGTEKLGPEVYFNLTVIHGLLINNGFSQEMIRNYFDIFEKYVGNPCIITHQDILSLAIRTQQIATNIFSSLPILELPRFFFIDGVYMSHDDKVKFEKVLNEVIEVQRFNYPILHRTNGTIILPLGESSINLIDTENLASLNGPLYCTLMNSGAIDSGLKIALEPNCFLKINFDRDFLLKIKVAVHNECTNTTLEINLISFSGACSYTKANTTLTQEISPDLPSVYAEIASNSSKCSTDVFDCDSLHWIRLGRTDVRQFLPSGYSVLELIDSCAATFTPSDRITCYLLKTSATPGLVMVTEDCLISVELTQTLQIIEATVAFQNYRKNEEFCHLLLINSELEAIKNLELNTTTKRDRRSAETNKIRPYFEEKNFLSNVETDISTRSEPLYQSKKLANHPLGFATQIIRKKNAAFSVLEKEKVIYFDNDPIVEKAHNYLEHYDRRFLKEKSALFLKNKKIKKKNRYLLDNNVTHDFLKATDNRQSLPQMQKEQFFLKKNEKNLKLKNNINSENLRIVDYYSQRAETIPKQKMAKKNLSFITQHKLKKSQPPLEAAKLVSYKTPYHKEQNHERLISKFNFGARISHSQEITSDIVDHSKDLRFSSIFYPRNIHGTLFLLDVAIRRSLTKKKYNAEVLPKKIQKGKTYTEKLHSYNK